MLDPGVEDGAAEDDGDGSCTATGNALSLIIGWRAKKSAYAYLVTMSPKNQTPRKDAAPPRTAEDTICVMGEVTLMESRDAMPMRKPNVPCETIEMG